MRPTIVTFACRYRTVTTTASSDLSFNLFRNRERGDLCCAVPETQAVPGFVTAKAWQFAGRVTAYAAPCGFEREAAREGAARIGFYLFQEAR